MDSGRNPSLYRIELKNNDTDVWKTLQEIDGDQQDNVTILLSHPDQSGNYTMRVIPVMEHEGTAYEGNGPQHSFTYSDDVMRNGTYGVSYITFHVDVYVLLCICPS